MTEQDDATGADDVDTQDVIELILADHRQMERLLRGVRDTTEDRGARLDELADLLVAHAEAEEAEVYPTLEARSDDEEVEHEVAHGEEEHAEINEKLLAALEASGDLDSDDFDAALEELGGMVNHHLSEEERNVLNPARDLTDLADRERLGKDFLAARAANLGEHPGAIDNVRRLVEQARDDGLLDD